ncbi:MAG: DNA polymerase III subunit delta' [Thiothrix sp.]|nr:DNA polymerase III subunit delta' [Thiothrix sp.]HPQ95111.1 DNA polymerase III subunit delta' [Thiolinea sp.]
MSETPRYSWHQSLWRQLQDARRAGRLPHALLFAGVSGCGHETLPRRFAASLLCLEPQAEGEACGHCRSCQVLAANAHPDFMQVTLAEDRQAISVEQVRELRGFLALSRSYSPVRVVVMPGADTMNVNAANSLLKTLEEPVDQTHILLQSTHASRLLPTIRSRCQQLRMPLPTQAAARQWLEQQALQHPAAELLALANGQPLLALALDSGVEMADRERFFQQLLTILQGQEALAEVSAQWEKYPRETLLNWQLLLLARALASRLSGETPAPLALLEAIPATQWWRLYDGLLELRPLAAHPLNARLFVESMLALWLGGTARRTGV